MKIIFNVLLALVISNTLLAQSVVKEMEKQDTVKVQMAEVACGKCMFDLPSKDCDLAVRVDGKAYYADGANIDDFGDAHADDGFCNAIRKANVIGRLTGDRFKIASLKLIIKEEH